MLAWVVLASSLLAVTKVSVTGERRLTAAQVDEAARVSAGTPLARVDTNAVAKRIEQLASVAAVTVSRSWPHTLKVTVVERQPVVAVPHGTSVVLLDGGGVDLGTVPKIPKGVFRLEVASPSPSDATTRAALNVLRGLPRPLVAQLYSMKASSPEQVTLLLRGGRTVLWGGAEGSAAKASALTALLKMPGTVFDVSAPGVVTRR
ncbi:MAG: peptidase [Frankiales bacterium]|nr:peptidase [Frankiales bacterium]